MRIGSCSPELKELLVSEGAFDKRGVQAAMSRLYYEEKRTRRP